MSFVNLLKRLAGLDPTAVTMTDDDPFELSPPRSPAAFLRSLPLLGPQPLYLCLEGITDDSLLPLLQQYSVPSQLNVARGIVWPKAALWHVPATSAVLEALACRLDAASQAAPSIHVFLALLTVSWVGFRREVVATPFVMQDRGLSRATKLRGRTGCPTRAYGRGCSVSSGSSSKTGTLRMATGRWWCRRDRRKGRAAGVAGVIGAARTTTRELAGDDGGAWTWGS